MEKTIKHAKMLTIPRLFLFLKMVFIFTSLLEPHLSFRISQICSESEITVTSEI